MNLQKSILAGIVVTLLQPYQCKAQHCLNATSHEVNIKGLSHHYIIGEMTHINTERTSTLIITQGFLQPSPRKYSISTENTQAEPLKFNLLKIYPNPATNYVHIENSTHSDITCSYTLFDASGKIVLQDSNWIPFNTNKISLRIENLSPGTYPLFIQTKDSENRIQNYSYKIQKTN